MPVRGRAALGWRHARYRSSPNGVWNSMTFTIRKAIRKDDARRPFVLAMLIALTAGGGAQAGTTSSSAADTGSVAQDTSTQVAANAPTAVELAANAGVEIITVTAQKRVENIQDVP